MADKPENAIYGLVFGLPSQKEIIDDGCFRCGKIIFAGIDGMEIGPLMVCRTKAEFCPYFGAEFDEPIGDVEGDPVYIRKLKRKEDSSG